MILSSHTARQLRNASLSALYRVAYDHDVDLADVMASITPSQPIPQAPAARTYPPVPVAVQAEDVSQAASSATSSSEQREQLDSTGCADLPDHKGSPGGGPEGVSHSKAADLVAGPPVDEVKTGKSAEPSGSAAPIGIKFPSKTKATTEALRKAVKASPAKPQEPVERAGPPTPRTEPKQPPVAKSADPKRMPIKHQVANLHSMHPEWDAARIAQEIGAKLGTVETALYEARAAAWESLSEPIPPANPQKPVAPPPVGELKTLNERVKALHEQHPNWTGRMIANELGANPNSVSVALARIRNPKAAPAPVEQPQFTGRRQMVEHYGEIAKRLGKS